MLSVLSVTRRDNLARSLRSCIINWTPAIIGTGWSRCCAARTYRREGSGIVPLKVRDAARAPTGVDVANQAETAASGK